MNIINMNMILKIKNKIKMNQNKLWASIALRFKVI